MGRLFALCSVSMVAMLLASCAQAPLLSRLDEEVTGLAARASRSVVHVECRPAPGDPRTADAGPVEATGVICDAAGHIVTAASVAAPGCEAWVTFASGKRVPAQVVGRDWTSGLAVLRAEAKRLIPARCAPPGHVRQGSVVVAVSSPSWWEQNVSLGVVSGTGRWMGLRNGFIQFAAPIGQADVGGMLVNGRGELAGIIVGVMGDPHDPPESGQVQPSADEVPALQIRVRERTAYVTLDDSSMIVHFGNARRIREAAVNLVGYAVPADEVGMVVRQLVEHGRVFRGYLGVGINSTRDGRGAPIVRFVEKGTPAEAAGIKTDDQILAVDGRRMKGADHLVRTITHRRPGTKVRLKVRRADETLSVTVVLAERPEPAAAAGAEPPTPAWLWLGITLWSPEQLAARPERPDEKAFWIMRVERGSPAEQAGLKSGDWIATVEGEHFATEDDLRAFLKERAGKTVSLGVIREGKQTTPKAAVPADYRPGDGLLDQRIRVFVELTKDREGEPDLVRELYNKLLAGSKEDPVKGHL